MSSRLANMSLPVSTCSAFPITNKDRNTTRTPICDWNWPHFTIGFHENAPKKKKWNPIGQIANQRQSQWKSPGAYHWEMKPMPQVMFNLGYKSSSSSSSSALAQCCSSGGIRGNVEIDQQPAEHEDDWRRLKTFSSASGGLSSSSPSSCSSSASFFFFFFLFF